MFASAKRFSVHHNYSYGPYTLTTPSAFPTANEVFPNRAPSAPLPQHAAVTEAWPPVFIPYSRNWCAALAPAPSKLRPSAPHSPMVSPLLASHARTHSPLEPDAESTTRLLSTPNAYAEAAKAGREDMSVVLMLVVEASAAPLPGNPQASRCALADFHGAPYPVSSFLCHAKTSPVVDVVKISSPTCVAHAHRWPGSRDASLAGRSEAGARRSNTRAPLLAIAARVTPSLAKLTLVMEEARLTDPFIKGWLDYLAFALSGRCVATSPP